MPSINADSVSGRDVDYSSYEYQQISYRPTVSGPDDDSTFVLSGEVEPLAQIGGLDANEVAELVAFRREATIVLRDYQNASSVVQGGFNVDYSFGVNLDSESDLVTSFQNADSEFTVLESADVNSDVIQEAVISTVAKDEILDFGTMSLASGFVDGGSAGGGADVPEREREFDLRADLGAGPVIDSGDNMSMVVQIEKDNAEIGALEVAIDYHLIWDVATVDDAGRRFGIPGDD